MQLNSKDAVVFSKVTANSTAGNTNCEPGKMKVDDICSPCPENNYGNDGTACEKCPDRKVSPLGSTLASQCTVSRSYPPGIDICSLFTAHCKIRIVHLAYNSWSFNSNDDQ